MIRLSDSHLHTAACTHPGVGGRENEDRFAISSFRLSATDRTPSVFAIVSDGIGGHSAGEVAAEMAVETISRMVARSDGREPLAILDRAIHAASDVIAAQAKDDTQRLGMGTTCACAWVVGIQLYIASVGDSRVYLLSNDSLRQLTTDHTWVQEAVEKGILKPQEAVKHPNVHVIRRYLGSSRPPQADVRLRLAKDESDTQARSNQGLLLSARDVLLLCTDGLTDILTDAEIEATVNGLEIQPAVEKLVSQACERGGKDNITVVLLSVPEGVKLPTGPSRFWKGALFALLGLILAALFLLAVGWVVVHFMLPPG